MSRALAKVEWIEQKSIQADGDTALVKVGINDKKLFSLNALIEAGYLVSGTSRAPVRLGFPIEAMERWFPKLYVAPPA